MAQQKDRKGLGRGLSALMADIQGPEVSASAPPVPERRGDRLVAVEKIAPNPDQPRRAFSDEALAELAASIRHKGVIQPLIVRPDPSGGDGFQIVAGERRWRAAQVAQIHELPVIVRDFDDTEVLEVAIIENIQRADLNPVEEAQGYRQLMDRFGHTQEQLAKAMGKSRSHIANVLRLLGLPDEVLELLREGRLTAGHARALITTEDPARLARHIVDRALSVRDVEKLVKSETSPKNPATTASRSAKDADTRALEADLTAALGLPVTIDHDATNARGKIVIRYKDLEQLDDLVRVLNTA